MIIRNMDIIRREPDADYRRQSKSNVGSHALGDFRKNPALYNRKAQGLISDEDRAAYLVGRAVHAWTLEGRKAFDDGYTRGGPINPKTGKPFGTATQAYQEWAASQGRPVLTEEQYALVSNIVAGVSAHDGARELLSCGLPEGVVRAQYCDVPCQIRMDWFNPERGLCDLKTADDLSYFCADAKRYGYLYQVAFYQAILALAANVNPDAIPVYFIGVEKRETFRCGVWRVDADALRFARGENEAALARLRDCAKRNYWPTGYEETQVFDTF